MFYLTIVQADPVWQCICDLGLTILLWLALIVFLVYAIISFIRSEVPVAMAFLFLAFLCFCAFMEVTDEKCVVCGAKVTSAYCEQCGAHVETTPEPTDPTCPGCGDICSTPFCGSCGTSMPEGPMDGIIDE